MTRDDHRLLLCSCDLGRESALLGRGEMQDEPKNADKVWSHLGSVQELQDDVAQVLKVERLVVAQARAL